MDPVEPRRGGQGGSLSDRPRPLGSWQPQHSISPRGRARTSRPGGRCSGDAGDIAWLGRFVRGEGRGGKAVARAETRLRGRATRADEAGCTPAVGVRPTAVPLAVTNARGLLKGRLGQPY